MRVFKHLKGVLECCWPQALAALFFTALPLAPAHAAPTASPDLSEWLGVEEGLATQFMLANIAPAGGAPGSVAAAPTRNNPDYFYHWVRDSAAVMHVVLELYTNAQEPERTRYLNMLTEYATFSRGLQLIPNRSGSVGEPKFLMDGQAFNGDWARPQNDGPASRAIVMSQFANQLLDEGQSELVTTLLYDARLPTKSLIKTDLEFVAAHGQDPCFDLWEESYGLHFYTQMMARRALLDGARLAARLGDTGAASYYSQRATALASQLETHWEPLRALVTPTFRFASGPIKTSGLDSSVVAAAVLAPVEDGAFDVRSERLLATVHAQEVAFRNAYPINQQSATGLVIGRYPEDGWDGYEIGSVGNPWVLSTAVFAQYYYYLAHLYEGDQAVTTTAVSLPFFSALGVTSFDSTTPQTYRAPDPRFYDVLTALRAKGDSFMEQIRLHANSDGSLSEQINRVTGFMQGAPNLGISYTTFLWATWARRGEFPKRAGSDGMAASPSP